MPTVTDNFCGSFPSTCLQFPRNASREGILTSARKQKSKIKREKNADAAQQWHVASAASHSLGDRVYTSRSDKDRSLKTEMVNTWGRKDDW
jgi:hypothetical protein